MTLWFDAANGCYLGERVVVDRALFDGALAELVAGGEDEAAARRLLLRETAWLDAGSAPLPLCRHCGAPLPPETQFCDLVCEAADVAGRLD